MCFFVQKQGLKQLFRIWVGSNAKEGSLLTL